MDILRNRVDYLTEYNEKFKENEQDLQSFLDKRRKKRPNYANEKFSKKKGESESKYEEKKSKKSLRNVPDDTDSV